MRSDDLRRASIDDLRTPGAVRHSTHASRVGLKREAYADFDQLIHDPIQCERIVRLISDQVTDAKAEHDIDALAFIEKADGGTTGAIALTGAVSVATNLPSMIVRLGKDIRAERIKLPPVEGRPVSTRLSGINVVVVSDHSTSLDEIARAARAVREFGGTVSDAVVYTAFPDEFKRDLMPDVRVRVIHSLPEVLQAAGL